MTHVRDQLHALVMFQQLGTFSNQTRGMWAWASHTNISIRVGCSPCMLVFSLSVQFSRPVVSNSLLPLDGSTPGLPVHHQLLKLTQTHVH